MNLSEAANRVIDLARKVREYYATELPERHPNYPVVSLEEERAPPPPEEKELRDFLTTLSEVMYLCRGDFGTDDLAGYYESLKGPFGDPEHAASQMMDKAPLADYLSDGRSHYRRQEALARRPVVTPFGPVLPGYRPGMSIREAIDVACAGVMPDIILHGGDFKASGIPLVTGLEDVEALTALELLDSGVWEDRHLEFIRRQRLGAVALVGFPGLPCVFAKLKGPQKRLFGVSAADRPKFCV